MTKPTYVPTCTCHTDPNRNFPNAELSPDDAITAIGAGFSPKFNSYESWDLTGVTRTNLFRSQLSWSSTLIGER